MSTQRQKAMAPQTATPQPSGLLQRACACGKHAPGGECAECKQKREGQLQRSPSTLEINQPGDRYEQEAERVAAAITSGRAIAPNTRTGPALVQRQETPEKPREQPSQWPPQEQPKQGQEKTDEEKEKLLKGGLKAASAVGQFLWDQFTASLEGKHILAANERDWKPVRTFFEDFAGSIAGKILGAGAVGGAVVGGAVVGGAMANAETQAESAASDPSQPTPLRAPKDEQFFGLELKWDFITPPSAATLKTPWLDSPAIPLGPKPPAATPALAPPPVLFKTTTKIPRICTPADPQGDQGEADARSALIFRWLQSRQKMLEQQLQDRLNTTKLHAPPPFAPSAVKPMFKRAPGAAVLPDPQLIDAGLHSPSQPLDAATRSFMEPRFGQDFSGVRIHTDAQAAESARAVNALAYTVGRDVVFGAGQFQPHSSAGQRLLAHELTHVVQQRKSTGLWTSQSNNTLAEQIMTLPTSDIQVTQLPQVQLMRSLGLDSTIKMQHQVLRGETVFQVSGGGLLVTIFSSWEPSQEWLGKDAQGVRENERPSCDIELLNVTLTKKGRFIDSEYGTCTFDIGTTANKQWTNLPDGDYFLNFFTGNTNPNCTLLGTVKAAPATGLSGETCTQLPPGPLEMLHDALSLAGLLPVLGAFPDAIDASIYTIQGDWINAGLSAAAIIPIFGDAASLGRIGKRTIVRIEGEAILNSGKNHISKGLKSAKATNTAIQTLKLPKYKKLRASADIDERLLELALLHRTNLVNQGIEFGSHNIAVVKVLINGKEAYLSARNVVHELHSEARLINQIDKMVSNKQKVEVLQIYSERIPCTKAGCMQALNARFPKADVFFSVSEELAEATGSKANALKVIYGVNP